MSEPRGTDPDRWLAGAAVPPLPTRAGGGPAPSAGDDASWDEHAAEIMKRARASGASHPRSAAELDALLAAPPLLAEPGEPASSSAVIVGASKMSESDQKKSPSAAPPSVGPASQAPMSQRLASGPNSQRPRPSLKELAERVSKTPPPSSVAPPSQKATSTPLPAGPSSLSAVAQQMAARASTPAISTPLPGAALATPLPGSSAAPLSQKAPPSLPSGPPSSTAAGPSSVQPGSSPPPSAVPASVAAVVPITSAKAQGAEPEQRKSGSYGGVIIALVGVAAAAGLFFFLRTDPFKAPASADRPTTQQTEAPAPKQEEASAESVAPAPEGDAPKEEDGAVDIDKLAEASAAPVESGAAAPEAPGGAVAQNDPAKKDQQPVKVNPDGTLDEAMRDAAGAEEKKEATPAAEETNRPTNIPDRPPTGSVTAAVGAVMGGAKSCVAGADDVSRATITFGSSGAVQSVAVSGWAAGKSAESCIKSALKGANVGPFSQPTFTFGVTIRP